MTAIPIEHVRDSHSLLADGRITLFELTPADDSGTIYFKPDNDVTWRGHTYSGIPMSLTGEKQTADSGLTTPKLTIGQANIDLSLFKPLINDGFLDNAVIVRLTLLLDNVINNRNIREIQTYRVKRIEEYSRTKITLQLATLSDSLSFQLPFRQYLPPAFPSVQM